MSIRLEMVQVARLAGKLLGESSDLVRDFILSQQNQDGGFHGRSPTSDLYYTVFGIDALTALQAPWDQQKIDHYVSQFGDGAALDFVHLCCLTHCHAALGNEEFFRSSTREKMIGHLAKFRSGDGGFHPLKMAPHGTAYGAFLGLSAYLNLREPLDRPLELARSLKFLETPDGGWANERAIRAGATNSSAAVVTLLRHLNVPVHPDLPAFFMNQFHEQGGFLAMPLAPMPDLLSTATALHALAGLEHDLTPIHDACLDYVDSLWTNQGAFHGHWADDLLDIEYTFYGLLALGHLSVYS